MERPEGLQTYKQSQNHVKALACSIHFSSYIPTFQGCADGSAVHRAMAGIREPVCVIHCVRAIHCVCYSLCACVVIHCVCIIHCVCVCYSLCVCLCERQHDVTICNMTPHHRYDMAASKTPIIVSRGRQHWMQIMTWLYIGQHSQCEITFNHCVSV